MTTSEIRKLFAEGKYSRSLSEIEASLQHPEVMLTEQLILQNNKELCQIMMMHSYKESESVTSMLYVVIPRSSGLTSLRLTSDRKETPHCDHYTKLKEVGNHLHGILDKCASVPVGRDILQIELVVLYNHVATVACTTLETPPAELETSPRSPPYSSCVQTLLRVYRLLHPSDYHSVRMKLPTCVRSSCYTIMDQCLDRLALPTGSLDLLWSVALCCCMLAVVEMLLGNTEQARRTLQKLKGILKIQAGIETEVPTSSPPVGLHMPLQLEPNVVHPCRTNCVDVCNFILGLCDFKNENWDECTRSMKAVKCTEMVDAVKYLKGMCLLRMEKYSDALPVLGDLAAASSLTQTYQAQMYNNIGNCLSKMNKPQLAIQMYKEALEADFGSLSPLYNIAVQYRELGTRNTELECLHSLVMALSSESAAPSDVSASPCVDLYRLVDLGNDDITYPQALYTLAQQYTRYDRHKDAAISYMDLITHLTSEMDTSQVTRSAGLPPVTQIYHETMQSLLEATKYTDCIAVCDRALLCFHNNSTDPNSTYDKSENDGCLSDHDFDFHVRDIGSSLCDSSRKRKRCSSKRLVSDESSCHRSQVLTDECHVNSWVDSLDKDIVTLQCKSKALLKLGDLQGARECLQRHKDAAISYMDLITHLTSEMDTSQVTRSAGLPPVTQIYHETMQSLLEATKYTDCIAVCDRALLCFHNNSTDPNSTYDKSENDGCLSDHDFDFHVRDIGSSLCDSSRKRKRCSSKRLVSDESSCHRSQVLTDECHVNSWVDSLDKDIVTLQCKSKALLKLGDLQGARECLQSAVDSVEAYRIKTFQTAATYSQLSPPNKRQRHDNTGNNNGSVTDDNQHANNVKPEEADPVSHVESDLYFCLGSTLEELGQLPDAIHCYRLAAQLTPGEVRIMYRCTQTLLAMNQTRQAVANWLSYRNMPLVSHYIKMKSQLEAKRKLVKSADSGLPSEEKHLAEMDITCLEYAMKYHQ